MPARLVMIPISRYCEKARWALDRSGIAYREECHAAFRAHPAGAFACRLFREER
jgi:hypothetical protein